MTGRWWKKSGMLGRRQTVETWERRGVWLSRFRAAYAKHINIAPLVAKYMKTFLRYSRNTTHRIRVINGLIERRTRVNLMSPGEGVLAGTPQVARNGGMYVAKSTVTGKVEAGAFGIARG